MVSTNNSINQKDRQYVNDTYLYCTEHLITNCIQCTNCRQCPSYMNKVKKINSINQDGHIQTAITTSLTYTMLPGCSIYTCISGQRGKRNANGFMFRVVESNSTELPVVSVCLQLQFALVTDSIRSCIGWCQSLASVSDKKAAS